MVLLKNGGDKKIVIGSLYIFIDSSNIWAAQKSKQRLLDYRKVLRYIKEKFDPKKSLKIFYYVAYPAKGTRDYDLSNKHKFFTFLKKGLGFKVRKKVLKRIKIIDRDLKAVIKEKGDMDVDITIDAIHYIDKYDTAIFFSGDSDFLPLINYLKRSNKTVYIFSSKNNVSSELRLAANNYFDLLNIDSIWGDSLKRRENKKITPVKESDSRM